MVILSIGAVRKSDRDNRPDRIARSSKRLAGTLFEQRPGTVAEFRLPLAVEAGLLQLRPETVRLRLVDGHAARRELTLQRLVELAHVLALLQPRLVERPLDDQLEIVRQRAPGAA